MTRLNAFKGFMICLLLISCASVGCKSVPDDVKTAIAGNLRDLRLVKKELVQTLPESKAKTEWLQNLAAFIVRARSLKAWADDVEKFDTVAAMGEEMERKEK